MGRSVFCLYYLAVWVEDKRLHLSFNNEVWQRLPLSVPWVYRVHIILMIGITGRQVVHSLPFLGLAGLDGTVYCLCHFYFTAIFHRASKKSLGSLHCRQFSRFHLWFREAGIAAATGKTYQVCRPTKEYFESKDSLFEEPPKVSWENDLLCLLVPAAKFFTNFARQAISRGVKSVITQLELNFNWTPWRACLLEVSRLMGTFLPWKSEGHIHLTLHSNASFSGWGGRLTTNLSH